MIEPQTNHAIAAARRFLGETSRSVITSLTQAYAALIESGIASVETGSDGRDRLRFVTGQLFEETPHGLARVE